MTGIYEHKIDAKGRLFIPSSLRDDLGRDFHVTITDEDCLTAFSNKSWERLLEKVEAMPIRKQVRTRGIFSNAKKCDVDSQGRITLPQNLRDKKGLVKDVTVVGVGTCVQFWDSEKFRIIDEEETSPENIAIVLDELDF
ncbi:MAG: division/cell wall cluster transcriptional repressor MraZ [Oscillospiraceae bacterium]|nr:division/cell wall cluster transcriptional repressor MraZ [Oscillospiraceae bacterium]